jgi:hypothetical protein
VATHRWGGWSVVGSDTEGVVDDDRDPRTATHHVRGRVLKRVEVVLGKPVAREPVGRADSEVIPLDRQQAARTNP